MTIALYALSAEILGHQVEMTAEGGIGHSIPCAQGHGRVHLSVEGDQLRARCDGGCKEREEIAALERRAPRWWANNIGEGPSRARAGVNLTAFPVAGGPSLSEESRGVAGHEAGHTKEYDEVEEQAHPNESSSRPAPEVTNGKHRPNQYEWQSVLYDKARLMCEDLIKQSPASNRELLIATDLETFIASVNKFRNDPTDLMTSDPLGLSATEIDEQIEVIARAIQKNYAKEEQAEFLPTTSNGRTPALALIVEQAEAASVTNAEYLARPEIVEHLGYSQSMALMIGAKHHGKTTNVRTLALSVLRGLPIWKRKTTQGPVVYVASDDEVASTRNELLGMGWRRDEPLFFARVNPDSQAEPQEVLVAITDLALKQRAILIILDMLFDFVAIKDELSYAGTRGPIAALQDLADTTKAFIVCSHHTPKYLTDAHNAANAALGSQGVAARFSPIILTRKWTETLFTVESTTVRDPRGEMLKPMKISRNEEGWIVAGEEFKEWMKWEIYAQKVLDLFEDPRRGYTVFSISEKLGLDRSRVQNTCKELERLGRLKREKQGRSFHYYLAGSDMFQREGGNWGHDN